jgi:amidohydrolase
MIDRAELRRRIAEVLPEIVELRHSFHRIPEIHFQERQTAALIRKTLAGHSWEILPPLVETDVVGLLRGSRPGGKCILLRSDIDALPVEERTNAAWHSTNPGKAHSCGHDGHMAILIGALRVLEGLVGELMGSVRFVFQPAEEEARGGKVLIEKGLLELAPRPDFAFALHGWAGTPVGMVSAAPGPMMAAADTFLITIKGRGGHAAMPQHSVDPVLAAAHVIVSLQSIVSRVVDPLAPVVLSLCRIEGGHTSNVIPESVVIEGTTRYFDRSLERSLREGMQRIIAGVCSAAGCTFQLDYEEGYVPLVNDPAAVSLAHAAVTRYMGAEAWAGDDPPTMGAEDFAFYLEKIPGALLRLGLGEKWPALHSPGFDFNDRALETGIMALVSLVLDLS